MGDEPQQRLPEAVDVGDKDWLFVAAKLRPRHLLHQLLERAEPAGQRHEGVGALEHGAFALMHVPGDDLLLRQPPRPLLSRQELGDDAGGHSAVVDDGARERPHQADGAAAVDETHAVFGEDLAEFMRRAGEGWIGAWAGPAINTYRI